MRAGPLSERPLINGVLEKMVSGEEALDRPPVTMQAGCSGVRTAERSHNKLPFLEQYRSPIAPKLRPLINGVLGKTVGREEALTTWIQC